MVSPPAAFTVSVSAPAVTGLSPASVVAGAGTFTLSLHGFNFASAAAVHWNNTALVTTFVRATQLTAVVPASLTASVATVQIAVLNPGQLVSRPIAFLVTLVPAISVAAVLNAFSSRPGAAPGSLISIYGSNLAMLAESIVWIDGVRAPLLFVSEAQINAQVPFEVPVGPATLVVETGGLRSAPVEFEVAATAPGILTFPGSDRAVAQHAASGDLVGSQNPAVPGRYITVYLTGQGLLDHSVPTGGPAPADPLSRPLAKVLATVGGKPADIYFAGLTPGYVGLLQVNLLIPDLPNGEQPLEITIGELLANRALLPVAGPAPAVIAVRQASGGGR